MKSKFLAALVIACAGLFAGLFAGVAAPASASCAPGFTSIPCTIADNLGQAPATTIASLTAAPGQLAGKDCATYADTGGSSSCGLPSIVNLAGQGCPPDGDGNDPGAGSCGLVAAPGQFAGAIVGLPGQAAQGVNQIVTAPQTIAGALAAAPGQFVSALQNGGTAVPAP